MTDDRHYIAADLFEMDEDNDLLPVILAIEAGLVLARYAEFVRQYGD